MDSSGAATTLHSFAGSGRVVAATDGTITLPEANDDSQAQAPIRDGASNQETLSATAAINHSTSTPVDLKTGDYSVTIDPDLRGEGVLGIKSLSRLLTGTSFADVMAVPFVLIDGTPVKLERSRLVDLRVYPDAPFVNVQLIGYAEASLPSRTNTVSGAAFEPGLGFEAVYDLGNDRYAFIDISAGHFDSPPVAIVPRIIVRSLTTGRRVASAPVEYVEVPPSGPITYNGITETGEFTAPLDLFSPNKFLVLGERSFSGITFTSSTNGDGQVRVIRAPGTLSALPQPDSSLSLDGRSVALYYLQSPDATAAQSGVIYTLSQLDSDVAIPAPRPKPIDEQCAAPVIDDGSASDAAPPLDVKSAWFDVDDANLYASIKVADLPAVAPMGTTYSWAMHWRIEHVTYDGRAILDPTGKFSFEFGYHNLNSALPSYSKTADVAGDYKIGANGVVRIWIPRSLLGLRDGDLLRDTSARSLVSANGQFAEADQAPNGANSVQGKGGDYVVKKCGSGATVALISVASRKMHGEGATFDVDLPLTGSRGIECRSGGSNGNYTLVFRFLNGLGSVGDASVTSGTGSITNSRIGADAHEYIVDLTGVANAQTITVSLTNVTDAAGNSSATVSASMAVLIGDTTADGFVNSGDISQTKSQSGQFVSSSNFREDVTTDGFLNSGDIGLVKSKSGTALP